MLYIENDDENLWTIYGQNLKKSSETTKNDKIYKF
nr:MAG TPA: hypothetical protein [Caudoviricetes sp.]